MPFKSLCHFLEHCFAAPKHGLLLPANKLWDGNPNFEFETSGRSNSTCASDPDTKRSVDGRSTFLCRSPLLAESKSMPVVALSVTESELHAATSCVQDMLFEMRVLESMGLKVKKPMALEVNNKGAKDLMNNWSIGGCTHHV